MRVSRQSASLKATIGVAVLALLVTGGVSTIQSVHAPIPSALDGVGTNPSDWSSHPGWRSQLLTTARGYDVIILVVEPSGSITAITDSSGLSFTQRFSISGLSEYFARATSPLKSDNITVVGQGMPFGAMQVFAVHSASYPAMFDQDPSVPASCAFADCGDCAANDQAPGMCSVSMQTSRVDFVVAAVAINDAPSCGGGTGGGVQGFTTLVHSGQATFSSIFEVDYALSTVPQSSVVFGCAGTDVEAMVMDGISLNAGS